ncbi:hypothetical protein F5X99DRAFT_391367 [Biscogniauxia marginata]|nr:hypothetical protein F5X99DRAFT_391367 [Biscogniauxia marginata]
MAGGVSKSSHKNKEDDVEKAFEALAKGVAKMHEQLINAEKNLFVQNISGSNPGQITDIKAKEKAEAQKQAAGVLQMFGDLAKSLDPNPNNTNPNPNDTNPTQPESSGDKPKDVFGPTESLPAKRPLAPEDYQLRMGPGWTVNDGLFHHVPQNKRRKRDVPYPRYVNHSYRSMYGLSTLQIAADAPISLCAMDTACDHIWKCLPQEVRRRLIIPPPNGPALWGTDEAARNEMYEKMGLAVYLDSIGQRYRFYEDLKRKQWVVWPIWVEDQWGMDYVTVCWYAEANPATPNVYDRLVGFTIIDPRRNPAAGLDGRHPVLDDRIQRIQSVLLGFLHRGGYDVNKTRRWDTLCSPMPLGEATSGERCFATVKQLCNNICDWFYEGMVNHTTGFTNLSQWVHPYQQRVEMTGINAWVLMATFDYNARVSVESILPNNRTMVTANGPKRMVVPYDLAAQFDDPPISSYDYLLPPNGQYASPSDQTEPPPPYVPNNPKSNNTSTSKSPSNFGTLASLFKSFSNST